MSPSRHHVSPHITLWMRRCQCTEFLSDYCSRSHSSGSNRRVAVTYQSWRTGSHSSVSCGGRSFLLVCGIGASSWSLERNLPNWSILQCFSLQQTDRSQVLFCSLWKIVFFPWICLLWPSLPEMMMDMEVTRRPQQLAQWYPMQTCLDSLMELHEEWHPMHEL